jgi:hypothetical protein
MWSPGWTKRAEAPLTQMTPLRSSPRISQVMNRLPDSTPTTSISSACEAQSRFHPTMTRTVRLPSRVVLNASQIFSAHKFTFNKDLKMRMSFEYCKHLIEQIQLA